MNLDSLLKSKIICPQNLYKLSKFALCAYCLCFSLSIALSQIFLISFMLFTLSAFILLKDKLPAYSVFSTSYIREYYLPLIFWVIVIMIGIPVSLDPLRSTVGLLKFSLYLFMPFTVFIFFQINKLYSKNTQIDDVKKYFLLMLLAQSLAGVHTIVSTNFAFEIKPKIPGALTESGQIVLILPIMLGFLYSGLKKNYSSWSKNIIFSVFFILFPAIFFAWHKKIAFVSKSMSFFLIGIAIVYIVFQVLSARKNEAEGAVNYSFGFKPEKIFPIFAMFILAAFILNLKRGPWFGGAIEVFLIGLFFSRSLMIGFITLMIVFSFTPPVYERIVSFYDHFFIGGGRFDMWKLGVQMIERFPMGVGFTNAQLMREFDPSLPITHRHMHNNILNVAVETGILGALVYIWWFISFLKKGFLLVFSYRESFKNLADEKLFTFMILIAIIAWQFAGVVEYNFGDGEIRLLAFVLIGFLMTIIKSYEIEK